MALVGGHFRIKQHLKQQVAEFREMREVAALDGVKDLVGLFQRVFADGVEGLFAVPGAAAGSAKPGHDTTDCSNNAAARAGSVTVCGVEFSWLV